jgi:hypothetical protein
LVWRAFDSRTRQPDSASGDEKRARPARRCRREIRRAFARSRARSRRGSGARGARGGLVAARRAARVGCRVVEGWKLAGRTSHRGETDLGHEPSQAVSSGPKMVALHTNRLSSLWGLALHPSGGSVLIALRSDWSLSTAAVCWCAAPAMVQRVSRPNRAFNNSVDAWIARGFRHEGKRLDDRSRRSRVDSCARVRVRALAECGAPLSRAFLARGPKKKVFALARGSREKYELGG